MNVVISKQKTQDIIWLFLINAFAIIASFVFEANFLTSTVLFLGVPSLYLLYREKIHFNKIFLASISFGIFFGFVFDFIAELNKAWDWRGGLLFGKVLGVVQIDVMVWFFLWIFHIFLFYEHFIDRKKLKSNLSARGLETFIVSVFSVILLITVYNFFPNLFYLSKAYLKLCLVILVPFLVICYKKPKLVWHTAPMVAYFFFVYLTHEITALRLGQWSFPGDYIGWVNIVGVSFPLEELIFWIILSSLIGGVYYELSFDNSKN